MRTDYFNGLFDDLPPAPVTHVTHRQTDCVTRETHSATSENNVLGDTLRTLRTLRTKPDNTGNETATRKNTAYHFRLHNGGGGGTYLTTAGDLEAARRELLKRYGDRLALVALA